MRVFCFVFLFLCVLGRGVGAGVNDPNDPNDPNVFLHNSWNTVAGVLQNNDMASDVKAEKVDKIVSPIFDWPLMAKLALGKTHWSRLTAPERVKFTELFVKRLKTTYLEKVGLYVDEKAVFKPAVRRNKSVYIPMDLVSRDDRVELLYKLRPVKNRWLIYDLEIQGVSIILTYRSQFNDILCKGTVKDLFDRLEESQTP